ncbi:MAG TPA: sigma-54 dependent transcriptional regulator [Polyangiaceae bacterium]|nr:sigma-54 dependent transcriptional regulator [Polyangiaceae bacterium]
MEARVLLIDDEKDVCDLLTEALEEQSATVVACTSAKTALERLQQEDFDVVLTDLSMAEMNGTEVCERVAGTRPGLPVVVVTGQGTLETAIAAIRVGAYDFVTKPIDPKLLFLAVGRAAQHHKLNVELKRLREAVDAASTPSGMVGSSRAMRRVHETMARVAEGDASVLIHGETGTGKELVAKRLHAMSGRRDGPFVAINCAAVPAALLESELFGHARGAFTDAKSERAGLFVQANGGTLFLDEVGEMPLPMQVKLLRALQERKVRPVGAMNEVAFDARLVTATNRDLEEEVEEKRFREDLFYRIHVVRIDVPPLRERSSDVLELVQHFLARQAERNGKGPRGVSTEAAQKLVAYRWPGNVRELENCIERAVAFARYDEITVEDLPEKIRAYRADHFAVTANEAAEIVSLAEVERRYVERVLSLLGGNKSRAAEVLGIDRRTLHRKIERWEHGEDEPTATPDGTSDPAALS